MGRAGERHRRAGIGSAARAVGLADGRAESPLETRGRLRILGSGLPAPELQVVINPGTVANTRFARNEVSTSGYVEQCKDSMFSKSGGIQGSCSQHGGNLRPLNA